VNYSRKAEDSIVVFFPQTDYKNRAFKMNGNSGVNDSFDLHNKGNQSRFHGLFSSLVDKLSLMGDKCC